MFLFVLSWKYLLLYILVCRIYFTCVVKMFKSKIACVALYKVSTPFCVKKEASLVRAAARQKHQFYGERIKPQTSHANPKLKFTKVWLFCTVDLSQSSLLYFSSSLRNFKRQPQAEVPSNHNILYWMLNVAVWPGAGVMTSAVTRVRTRELWQMMRGRQRHSSRNLLRLITVWLEWCPTTLTTPVNTNTRSGYSCC